MTIVEGNPKAPFSIATTRRCRGGRYSFPGLLYFTLDPYLIMLSVKQGDIKYHFLSLWYDATWDWTHVSRAIGEHYIYIYIYIYTHTCRCACVCIYKILFNTVNLESGTIPTRTNKIFKNRILNLSNPSQELNVNKIHRANNFLIK